MNIKAIFMILFGAFLFLPSFFDWDWDFLSWGMRLMTELLGREKARLLHMFSGGFLMAGGLLILLFD